MILEILNKSFHLLNKKPEIVISLALIIILSFLRTLIFYIKFWPGFGTWNFYRLEQTKHQVKQLNKEINNAEKNKNLYQSLTYLDYSIYIILILFLLSIGINVQIVGIVLSIISVSYS